MNPRLKKTLTSAGIFFVVYLATSFVIEVMVHHQSFSPGEALITAGVATISYAVVFFFVTPLNKKRTKQVEKHSEQ